MKRIAVEDQGDGSKNKLTAEACLTLLNALLNSKGLKTEDRLYLNGLKSDLSLKDLAEDITEFMADFLDNELMARLAVEGLRQHDTGRRRRERKRKEK